MIDHISAYSQNAITFLSALFIFAVGTGLLFVAIVFTIDSLQHKDAIRHNYPVVGRLRHIFTHFGVFFRQYFFSADREEMPFNREQRNWVYRAARGDGSAIAFGSTRDLRPAGTVIFLNCPFPILDEDSVAPGPILFGSNCPNPYSAGAFYNISAMSYGAISKPAVQALSHGAARAGCWLNTGEGGLSPWHLEGGSDLIFQIGTAMYGVRDENGDLDVDKLTEIAAHSQVKMFEIKLAQGAKPGKGGILPAAKVTDEIAKVRGIPVGKASISPNRFPNIDNIGELLDFIERVRRITGKPTGFKTVIGAYGWIDEFCQEIGRRGPNAAPDFITIDGGDGGSGAAPASLMDNVGLQIQEALPLVDDRLTQHGLRDRIKLIAAGKLITSTEVAWALAAGADAINSARGFMLSLGCIQAMRCNTNKCPTGVATHNPRLQGGLDPSDKATKVENYAKTMVKEVCTIAQSCGVTQPSKLKRHHCHIVMANGRTKSFAEIYPNPTS